MGLPTYIHIRSRYVSKTIYHYRFFMLRPVWDDSVCVRAPSVPAPLFRRAIERGGGGGALASKPGCATATAATKPSSSSLVGPQWQREDDEGESHCAAEVHLLRKKIRSLYMWEIEWKSEKS